MKAIFGLLVLTGPLFIVVLWLPLCWWIARKTSKRFASGGTRWASGAATFVVVFLLPFADSIVGHIYLKHLCSTEAGVKVYQSMELPAEYWDENGKPRFFNKYDRFDHKLMGSKIDGFGGRVERYSSVFAINKHTSPIKERGSQKILAEVSTFHFWGGWVSRNFSPSNAATSCEFMDAPDFDRNFYGQLFKPATSI